MTALSSTTSTSRPANVSSWVATPAPASAAVPRNSPRIARSMIIAKEFEVRDGPELVLKTHYGASPISLPNGVGNEAHPKVRQITWAANEAQMPTVSLSRLVVS